MRKMKIKCQLLGGEVQAVTQSKAENQSFERCIKRFYVVVFNKNLNESSSNRKFRIRVDVKQSNIDACHVTNDGHRKVTLIE